MGGAGTISSPIILQRTVVALRCFVPVTVLMLMHVRCDVGKFMAAKCVRASTDAQFKVHPNPQRDEWPVTRRRRQPKRL